MIPGLAILAADTNGRNLQLLAQFLGRAGFHVIAAANLDEFDAILDSPETGYDLALVDLSGFDESILDRCDRLHQRHIPWLAFCLAHQEQTAKQVGYRHGTRGVLVKPLSAEALVRVVQDVVESGA